LNYYERHLGDYAKDTLGLSMLEHGAYNLLIDRCYAKEEGIPQDKIYKVALARTKEERAAVDSVLQEFFKLENGVWNKNRITEEIFAYKSGEPEREAKKANESNRLRRHRDERADLFKILTDSGDHAAWNIGINELREIVKRIQGAPCKPLPATAPATPATATQTPDPDTSINTNQPVTHASTSQKFSMHIGWKPSEEFATLAKMAMVAVPDGKLGEFIAHWLTQPITQRTQAEWDKALLKSAQHDKLRAASPLPARGRPAPDNFATKDYGTGVNPL